MHNIALIAALEGTRHQVTTDWFAIMAMLKTRNMSDDAIELVYNDLCAGVRVTTRGLTLAKAIDKQQNESVVK
ncbi:hypothetical protein K8B83_19720 [Shewanella inventionis]|uniref:Uncharacterized protein n=1 Tax=Shewanella inventionis TaxID=1738770 RepID=A0ABQ1J1N7_9GAMM|nr:hypothetical protein [Shewanella inventionis]MCL1158455.1 hypothetical protein [Shewanella inventionis]UAL43005.1 hypothetical protein K8B83_19720 [Shewanella inventionis]GGB56638.1 hypothetical protein GCM10011607_16550 [Shewanella inventionis]